jgi:hypothetical protein
LTRHHVPRRTGTERFFHRDDGAALVLVLLVTILLTAVGSAVILVADVDRVAAANVRDRATVRASAEAVAAFGVQALAQAADWSSWLATAPMLFSGSSGFPPHLGGGGMEPAEFVRQLQGVTFPGARFGANTPRWRLMGHGLGGGDLPLPLQRETLVFVAVADDVGEEDGEPGVDSNDTLLVRATAFSVRGGRADVQLVVQKTASAGVVRLITHREVQDGW